MLAASEPEQPVKVAPNALAKKLPSKEPCYTFYSWPNASSDSSKVKDDVANPISEPKEASAESSGSPAHASADEVKPAISISEPESIQASKVAFIYTCPAASAVRYRMVYSCSLRGLIRDALDNVGLSVDQKVSTKPLLRRLLPTMTDGLIETNE